MGQILGLLLALLCGSYLTCSQFFAANSSHSHSCQETMMHNVYYHTTHFFIVFENIITKAVNIST